MKIEKIERISFDDYVYNLELKTNSSEDDLYWIENKSGIVTHNCFPKDMAAILNIADSEGISMPTLFGAHTTNQLVRKNRDWEEMKGRAVVDYIAEDDETSNKVELEDGNII